MTHRHYGIPVSEAAPDLRGATRAAAWSGGAIIGGIIARDRAGFHRLRGEQDRHARCEHHHVSAPHAGQGSRAP